MVRFLIIVNKKILYICLIYLLSIFIFYLKINQLVNVFIFYFFLFFLFKINLFILINFGVLIRVLSIWFWFLYYFISWIFLWIFKFDLYFIQIILSNINTPSMSYLSSNLILFIFISQLHSFLLLYFLFAKNTKRHELNL
jgi:hypothetical protein